MTHSIKLDDQTYLDLDRVRVKGETFSQVVERMLKIRYQIAMLTGIVEGSQAFWEWQNNNKGV